MNIGIGSRTIKFRNFADCPIKKRVSTLPVSNSTNETIPQLSEGYYKARRQFGLYSAILLTWEYLGIQIVGIDSKEQIVNAATIQTPVVQIFVTIRAPEVIPILLCIVVIYFGYRLSIEWQQSSILRRDMQASKIDRNVAYGLGCSAIIVYMFQKLSQYQLADIVTVELFTSFLVSSLSGIFGFYFIPFIRKYRRSFSLPIKTITITVHSLYLPPLLILSFISGGLPYAIAFGMGHALGFILWQQFYRKKWRKVAKANQLRTQEKAKKREQESQRQLVQFERDRQFKKIIDYQNYRKRERDFTQRY